MYFLHDLPEEEQERTWWNNAKGHNQMCLKCKAGCSKYSYFSGNEDRKLNTGPETPTSALLCLTQPVSSDLIATAYANRWGFGLVAAVNCIIDVKNLRNSFCM